MLLLLLMVSCLAVASFETLPAHCCSGDHIYTWSMALLLTCAVLPVHSISSLLLSRARLQSIQVDEQQPAAVTIGPLGPRLFITSARERKKQRNHSLSMNHRKPCPRYSLSLSLSLHPSHSGYFFLSFLFLPCPMFASPLRYPGGSSMRYRISGGMQAFMRVVCLLFQSLVSFFFLSFIILDSRCKRISTGCSSHWFLYFNQESSLRIGFIKPVLVGISCYHRHGLYLDEPLFFRLVRFHYGRRRPNSQGKLPRPSSGPASLHAGLQRYAIQHVAVCNSRYAVSAFCPSGFLFLAIR